MERKREGGGGEGKETLRRAATAWGSSVCWFKSILDLCIYELKGRRGEN